jgi:hypothetical protein
MNNHFKMTVFTDPPFGGFVVEHFQQKWEPPAREISSPD